jgi:Uri superfamily endonuclease
MISYRLRALKTLYFYFCKFIKEIKEIETIFANNFARNYEKIIILGTSDACSTSHLSRQTSEPAYYIVDCRISSLRDHQYITSA